MSDVPNDLGGSVPTREVELSGPQSLGGPESWNPVPGATAPGAQTAQEIFVQTAAAAEAVNAAQVSEYVDQSKTFIDSLAGDSTGSKPTVGDLSTATELGADTPMDGPVFTSYVPGKEMHWDPPGVDESP